MKRIHALMLATTQLCLMGWSGSARAQHTEATDRMLASVVYVECQIDFQGKIVERGSGTGFLVAGLDHVVTNNHVVTSCHPDNKIKWLYTRLYDSTMDDIKAKKWPALMQEELKANPDFVDKLRADPALLERYLKSVAQRVAEPQAKAAAPSIRQKLFVVVLGKSSKEPVNFDVTRILWASETGNEKARLTGVDLAVLKLDRPIPDGVAVTFATGESARVNDQVYAVGFPGASGNAVSSNKYVPTMKRGIVSKLNGESPDLTPEGKAKGLKGAPVIEMDANISGGNSGGPLYNEYGDVLGVNTFGSTKASGVNWAQDAAVVIPVLQDLGLPLPRIRTAPPTWVERNETLVWGGSAGIAAVLLAGMGMMVLRKPARSAAGGSAGAGSAGARPAGGATPSAASLVALEGQFRGIQVPIPARGLELGRGMPADGRLAFAEDSDVSRHHALIVYDEKSRRFRITDLGSSNGTSSLPDGKKLPAKQEMEFRPGQTIRLGDHNVFELKAN